MSLEINVEQLASPILEFGSPGSFTDPKTGLRDAGPFDLRFGAAHLANVKVGLVGPTEMIQKAARWLQRCEKQMPAFKSVNAQYPGYPGFERVFHSRLEVDAHWMVDLDKGGRTLADALALDDSQKRFRDVLDRYDAGIEKLVNSDVGKPDVVLCCISPEVITRCWSVRNTLTPEEKAAARVLKKQREAEQLSLVFEEDEIEETEDDLLFRDFRRALKAKAMRWRIPIQLGTNGLFEDAAQGQDPATRAWNSTVALYYKAGGIPWRLKTEGPETCFVGISFHHLKTRRQHLVFSGIAQAFSTDGEGFALRGIRVPWTKEQGRKVKLTTQQAHDLGAAILAEYHERTGTYPVRIVLHKTSLFDQAEHAGFETAFKNVPVTELLTLAPTDFRLVRFGSYPPRRGTLCSVNDSSYLFTTGYMPEWGTYPGPHVPMPLQIRANEKIDVVQAANDVLALTRMNWNTASITGGRPVTLSFSRRVGGIMAEAGEGELLSSFRYYM